MNWKLCSRIDATCEIHFNQSRLRVFMLNSFPCLSRMVHQPKDIQPTWLNHGKHWIQHGHPCWTLSPVPRRIDAVLRAILLMFCTPCICLPPWVKTERQRPLYDFWITAILDFSVSANLPLLLFTLAMSPCSFALSIQSNFNLRALLAWETYVYIVKASEIDNK